METPFSGPMGNKVRAAFFVVVVLLGVFLFVQSVLGFMNMRYVGAGIDAANVITVSGTGEAYVVPDIGEFTYSVVALNKKTVAEAQAEVTETSMQISAYLKEAGVTEKDIKTVDYSIYPHYEWTRDYCVDAYSCSSGKQTLTGYDVRQTNQVRVRDIAKAGDLLSNIGDRGATELSGLTFTTEDSDAVDAEARAEAIEDAQMKAKELARSLGVSLVRIVSFTENSGRNYPMYYGYATGGAADQALKVAPEAADISVGQNKVTSTVSITYEIR